MKKIFWLLTFLAIVPAIIAQSPIKPKAKATVQTKELSTKTFSLTFDKLNNFVVKGLPEPAFPDEGDMDFKAVMMAKKILKLDSNSLPVLITALQTAGFFIIDENRKILRYPLGDGKGQGLAFYDFETVGMLKLENHGATSSLNKIAGLITKDNTSISASEFSQMMLKDLQQQAENPTDSTLRFWARLIIELGKSSAQNLELLTTTSDNISLNMLQVTLWTRRLTGDFYALNKSIQVHGFNHPSTSNTNSFLFASWNQNEPLISQPPHFSAQTDLPCNLTNNESIVMDASANILTAAQGWAMEKIGHMIKSAPGMAGFSKLTTGLFGVNLALAWLKLVAAVTMLQGEITVDKTPLIRTMNSVPGERCLMKARIWSTVGKVQMLNCVRLAINAATGLDFNLPTDGPVSGTAVEWHFKGDNEIRINNADTRNMENFVLFESPQGKDRNPQNQVTDDDGVSLMWLIGRAKIPEVGSSQTVKVPKTADVIVGVMLKSSKNIVQNLIDIGGGAVGIITGGPLGILMAIPEFGYRLPYVAAKASIAVIDHEPCDGQWFGNVTYSLINSYSTNRPVPPKPNDGFQVILGGNDNSSHTETLTGTFTSDGNDWIANCSADEIMVMNHHGYGKVMCTPKTGWHSFSNRYTITDYGSGNVQGISKISISIYPNGNYKVSVKPLTVETTKQRSENGSFSGHCDPKVQSPTSQSFPTKYSGPYIVGEGSYGANRDVLSGSTTNRSGTRVTTINWNLRRCK